MSDREFRIHDPRMLAAIAEIKELVLAHYPGTTFSVGPGEDPGTVWVWARVDVDDTDEVGELVDDRFLDRMIEERIPLLFIPIRTRERIAASRRDHPSKHGELAPTGTQP